MEMMLAKKIQELELMQLIELLRKLRTEDAGAYSTLKELVEDL